MKNQTNLEKQISLYNQIKNDWYANTEGYVSAEIKPHPDGALNADGFKACENAIYLYNIAGEMEIQSIESLLSSVVSEEVFNAEEWKPWKRVIIHEALHEYEVKYVKEFSEEAKNLMCAHQHKFSCKEKHAEHFFQAILDKSKYFCILPDELVSRI